MPRPTWNEFVPPDVSVGLVPAFTNWLNVSLNVTREPLNPIVLTLAMLLPITSIIAWWFLKPDTPAKSELRSAIINLLKVLFLAGLASVGRPARERPKKVPLRFTFNYFFYLFSNCRMGGKISIASMNAKALCFFHKPLGVECDQGR